MAITDSVQYTLRPKDIMKVSEMYGIDIATLENLNAYRLLNTTYIRSVLIRADYERLTSGLHWLEHNDKKYRFPEVLRAIRNEYNISKEALKKILYGKLTSTVFCTKCGIRITPSCYKRTGGLCSNCFADTMEL